MTSNADSLLLSKLVAASLLFALGMGAPLPAGAVSPEGSTRADERVLDEAVTAATERFQTVATRSPDALTTVFRRAFGTRLDPGEAQHLVQMAALGRLPFPARVLFVAPEVLADALGAYAAQAGGLILINADLRKHPAGLSDVIVHEWAHHLDATLGHGDAPGEEGQAVLLGLNDEGLLFSLMQTGLSSFGHHHTTIRFEGRTIEVELFFAKLWNSAKRVVSSGWNAAKRAATAAANAVRRAAVAAAAAAKRAARVAAYYARKAAQKAAAAARSVAKAAAKAAKWVGNAAKTVGKGVANVGKAAFNAVKKGVKAATHFVGDTVKGAYNAAKGAVQGVAAGVAAATGNSELAARLAADSRKSFSSSGKSLKGAAANAVGTVAAAGDLYNKTAAELNKVVPHLGTVAGIAAAATPAGAYLAAVKGVADTRSAYRSGGMAAALKAGAFAAADVALSKLGRTVKGVDAAKAAQAARGATRARGVTVLKSPGLMGRAAGQLKRATAFKDATRVGRTLKHGRHFKATAKEIKRGRNLLAKNSKLTNKWVSRGITANKVVRVQDFIPGRDRDSEGRLRGTGGSQWDKHVGVVRDQFNKNVQRVSNTHSNVGVRSKGKPIKPSGAALGTSATGGRAVSAGRPIPSPTVALSGVEGPCDTKSGRDGGQRECKSGLVCAGPFEGMYGQGKCLTPAGARAVRERTAREEEARRAAQAEADRTAREEEARRAAQAEADQRAREEAARVAAQAEADRRAREEAARVAAQAEADRRAREEARRAREEAQRAVDEQYRRDQEEAQRIADEEAWRAQEEAQRAVDEQYRREQEEAQRRADEEAWRAQEEAQRAADEQYRREQEEAQRAADEQYRREQEEAQRRADEEAWRAQEEAQRAADEQYRREQEEAQRAADEQYRREQEEAQRAADEQYRRDQEEAERAARRAREMEGYRRAQEENARNGLGGEPTEGHWDEGVSPDYQ